MEEAHRDAPTIASVRLATGAGRGAGAHLRKVVVNRSASRSSRAFSSSRSRRHQSLRKASANLVAEFHALGGAGGVGDWDVAWFASSSSFSLRLTCSLAVWSFLCSTASSTKIDINPHGADNRPRGQRVASRTAQPSAIRGRHRRLSLPDPTRSSCRTDPSDDSKRAEKRAKPGCLLNDEAKRSSEGSPPSEPLRSE